MSGRGAKARPATRTGADLTGRWLSVGFEASTLDESSECEVATTEWMG